MEHQIEQNIRDYVMNELSRNTLLKDENIMVDIEGNEVILEGGVDSFDKKWLAEDIACGTFGVLHVRNNIHVIDDNDQQREIFYEDQ